ncbi:hypothetical protein ASPCADRAFT_209818 [Aspergillus carbonarius ITEM 5010]|uniref:Uncharacterized protein n=1 Tax=Aspergillus carbonarius (strain ITEM 5010) TaxID=602072 RepID=A0A1R3RFJ3_ASPC5|nr:hypothetical protein ASPCADRAFT_209818 [Aspergillus carbonarius ITEM 5010]
MPSRPANDFATPTDRQPQPDDVMMPRKERNFLQCGEIRTYRCAVSDNGIFLLRTGSVSAVMSALRLGQEWQ